MLELPVSMNEVCLAAVRVELIGYFTADLLGFVLTS